MNCALITDEVEKLIRKQAITLVAPVAGQFLSHVFTVPKKDGSQRLVVNLRPLNHFVQKHHFKMEGAGMLRDLLQRNDWLVSIDLKDAYLSIQIAEKDVQEVPTLPVERADIRGSVPPLRAQQCTQSFHKAPKTSNGPPETTRDTHNNLSGRLVSNGSIKGRDGQPSGRNPTILATLGVCDQPGEICALPKSHYSILGLYCGLSSNGDLSTSKESGRHNQSLPSSTAARDPLSSRPVEADRPNVSHNAGSITGTFVLSKSAKDKISGAQPLPFVRGDGNIGRQCKGGVTMVSSSAHNMEWQSNPITNSRPCSGNRRTPSGLAAVSEGMRSGGLWSEKERTQHINCLELMAGALAVRTFAKHKRNIHV